MWPDQFGNDVADGTSASATTTAAGNGAGTQPLILTTTTTGGLAHFTETANTIAGSYSVTVTVGAATSAPITLTNTAGAASKVKPGVNGNLAQSGTPQSATVTTAFSLPFSVLVTDQYDNPVSGALVTFTLPGSGASVNLSSNPATTGANGVAAVTGIANASTGLYHVPASVAGGTQTTTFDLTNTGAITTIGGGTPQVTVVGTEIPAAR